MSTNAIVARLSLLFHDIIYLLGRQRVPGSIYVSFIRMQTAHDYVSLLTGSYGCSNTTIPISNYCNIKYTFSVFTRRSRITLVNACSILTGKAELHVCVNPTNEIKL